MISVQTPIEKAAVIHPRFSNARADDAEYDLTEAVGLAEALGVDTKISRIIPTVSYTHLTLPTICSV